MDIIGIVAEFDPFHRGHAHLIARARARYPGCAVVCAMSGPFTQRGGAAIASKYARAEMALRGGADLVLELPVQWAAASAERFARGGVALLAAAGANRLAFGSEAGRLQPLLLAAEGLDSPAFPPLLREGLDRGLPFAAARQEALRALLGEEAEVLARPNNLLGVEYLRALRALGVAMEPFTVSRVGSGHNTVAGDTAYPSSSALRAAILGGRLADVRVAGLGGTSGTVLVRELGEGRAPAALEHNLRGVFTRLRSMTEADFAALPDCGEGLERRMVRAAGETASLSAFYHRVKSKRYAHSRVRRLTLWAYLGLTAADCPETPPYLRVLGLREGGRAILRRAKELDRLPIVTKPAAVGRLDEGCRRQFDIDGRVQRLWELCLPEVGAAVSEWTRSPVVLL